MLTNKYEQESVDWQRDHIIKRPLNEYQVPHPDGRRGNWGTKIPKIIEFGWDCEDVLI